MRVELIPLWLRLCLDEQSQKLHAHMHTCIVFHPFVLTAGGAEDPKTIKVYELLRRKPGPDYEEAREDDATAIGLGVILLRYAANMAKAIGERVAFSSLWFYFSILFWLWFCLGGITIKSSSTRACTRRAHTFLVLSLTLGPALS